MRNYHTNDLLLGPEPIQSSVLMTEDRFILLRLRIKAGETLPPHKADGPVTILTISGQGLLSGPTTTGQLKSGTLSLVNPNELHWIEARTDVELLVTKFSGY